MCKSDVPVGVAYITEVAGFHGIILYMGYSMLQDVITCRLSSSVKSTDLPKRVRRDDAGM